MDQVKHDRDHPRDAHGRILPDPGWPRERAAPGRLEFVRRFANSVNRENGAERFTDAAAIERWLEREQYATPINQADVGRLIDLREVLFIRILANRSAEDDTARQAGWQAVLDAASPAPLTWRAEPGGLAVEPLGSGASAILTELLLIAMTAAGDGTWRRLKACDHCRWVVWDASKNAGARWCSMRACGTRHNASAYRRRQAGFDATPEAASPHR